jgi:hypothetical protein
MHGLDRLEMLGIDARSIVEPKQMKAFASSLPPSLVALHIQSCWENLPVEAAEFQPLVDNIALFVCFSVANLLQTDSESTDTQVHSVLTVADNQTQ